MRILSTGDWHFCAGYDEDIVASVKQIIEYLKTAKRVDLIAVTGDVYDHQSAPRGRNLAAELIQEMAEHAQVLVVKGNHDAPEDLQIFNLVDPDQLVWVDEAPASRYITAHNVVIHTMPWLTKARWVSLHPEASKQCGDKSVSDLALQFLRNAVLLHDISDVKHILVGHLTIKGARAQNHQPMVGEAISLGEHDLHETGLYAALLGHIHLKQDLGGNPRFLYNGSVAALNYGETPDKYFSVLDTDSGEVEWHKLDTVDRYSVDIIWTHERTMDFGVSDGDPRARGARVRVNLRIEEGEDRKQAEAVLTSFYEAQGALEVKINPQILPKQQVRSIEISKAQSLSEKLDRYQESSEPLDETTMLDMKVKLSELEELCSQ